MKKRNYYKELAIAVLSITAIVWVGYTNGKRRMEEKQFRAFIEMLNDNGELEKYEGSDELVNVQNILFEEEKE